TFSLLKYVVEVDNIDFYDCIEELILVSLVIPEQFKNEQNEIARKFYILPLTKGYIRQQLNQNNEQRNKILKRINEVENTITTTEQAKREYRFSMHNLGAVTEEEKIASIFSQTAFQKYQAGFYDEAVENYKKAMNIAPKFSSVYRNWAVMESYENHLFEADQLMQKASELNPKDPQIWLLWGNINRKAGKVKDADEKYKLAFGLSPDNHIVLNAYGQTRGRLGDYAYSLELLTKALKTDTSVASNKHEIINRSSIAETLINWSELLFRDRDKESAEKKLFEALEHCNQALNVDIDDPKSLGVLVKTYYKIGKFFNMSRKQDDAVDYFNKSIDVSGRGFKITKYKMKSSIELSKILYDRGQFTRINELLNPLTVHSNIFKHSPEILVEINQILEMVGSESNLLEGRIRIVSIFKDYVLVEKKDDPDMTFIAGKFDFNPKLNSLNKDLMDRRVKFVAKVYRHKGQEKREAKNIIIIG
ncbi:MAG: tetratricopeptide repeat protein, partial [Bacteroidota bacterium]